jgi:hypothetical protein
MDGGVDCTPINKKQPKTKKERRKDKREMEEAQQHPNT